MNGPAAPDMRAVLARPLCVQCRGCSRRTVFGSMSPEARGDETAVTARLVCRNCGGRGVKAIRLSDDREAARWLADR